MRLVEPTIALDDARHTLERRWWHRFRRRAPATSQPVDRNGAPTLPRIELIYLPYYLVIIETTFRAVARDVNTLVEAYSGSFAILGEQDVTRESGSEHPCFPPAIELEDATEIARNGLALALLRSRGGQRKPQVGEVRKTDLLGYPFWVYYYERRRKRLDIKVLDAVTGRLPGPKVKSSLLAAFIAKRQRDQA